MPKNFDKVSVTDLLSESKLDKIEEKDLPIFSLLKLKKKLGATEFHKYLFLSFAEDHIILPFKFEKHFYGPFSRDLEKEIIVLKNKGLINVKRERIIDFSKKNITLTKKGKDQLKKNSEELSSVSRKLKKVLNKYSDYGARGLGNFCYDTYLLRPKRKSISEWEIERKSKISKLRSLNTNLLNEFSNFSIEENKKILICTSLDYTNNLLESKALNKVDEVISGTLLKNIESYLNNWNKISIMLKENKIDQDSLIKIIKENNKVFSFLNKVAKEYDVMDSVFDGLPCIM